MINRVGIITYHHTSNYGATLQAYSINRMITSLGFDCEIIDYRPYKAVKAYLEADFLNRHAVKNLKKRIMISNFLHNNVKLSVKAYYKYDQLTGLANQYSTIICGSDEIWNVKSFRGFDPSYFADFATSGVRKCSYAASVGSIYGFEQNSNKINSMLDSFYKVSVRDKNTADILEKECSIKSQIVADPTLLLDFDFENLYFESFRKRYVLVYGVLSKEEKSLVSHYADLLNLELISVGYYNGNRFRNIVDAGIVDWIKLIRDADLVVTCFYHGVVLSVKYNTPFLVCQRQSKMNKIGDLLNYLKLGYNTMDAKITNPSQVKNYIVKLSEDNIKERDELIGSSISYLKSCLLN